jgi:uncharacterized protein (TIGR00255 family)
VLYSMTGYGDARRETENLTLTVEVRSVNNRYLKISIKSPEGISGLDSDIEKVVRQYIARGTVSVTFRTNRTRRAGRFAIDQEVLGKYWQQLHDLAETIHVPGPVDLGSLLQLPGAIREDDSEGLKSELTWPLIREALSEAMENLQEFRTIEGRATRNDLSVQCSEIRKQLAEVEKRVPNVVAGYRDRLLDRVREIVDGLDVEIQSQDLIREVSIFAERSDINEEITRLCSHLDQFDTILDQESSMGRKLEFLGQEMNREINTIGSKANDVEIAHYVVEMKGAIEKIREILQNVE